MRPVPPTAPAAVLRLLLLEDSTADAELVARALRGAGIAGELTRVETREAFLREVGTTPPDVILSDYALPGFDGSQALAWAREHAPDVPFIFVTGTLGEEVAIGTLRNGATDYVLKTRLGRLGPAVRRALREAAERRERARAEEELRRSLDQLRALTSYLHHVREEERTRIAREVHDELGQALTGLKLDLSLLAGSAVHVPRAWREKARTMIGRIDATIQTVRRITTELRPGILDSLGLAAALEWQAHEFQQRTGVPCHIVSTVGEPAWSADFATVFFRIFQETLTNVIRHAGATRVDVALSEEDGRLVLEVADDGRGITDEALTSPDSLGLVGMRERASLVGGALSVRRRETGGTLVRLEAPLPLAPGP